MALLRLQLALAVRRFADPVHAGGVAIVVAFVVAAFVAAPLLPTMLAVPALVLGVPVALIGIVEVLDAMDEIRWTAPVSPRAVLGAHMLFWAAVSAVAAAGIACLWGLERPWQTLILVDLAIAGATAAAAAPILQRVLRRWHGPDWALRLVVALGVVVALIVTGLVMVILDDGATGAMALAIVFCATLTLGAWAFLRGERLPVASGGASASRSDQALVQATPATTRSPLASIVRASWPPFWTCAWVAMGIGWQFLPAPSDGLALMFVVIAASNLVQIGLASWRWLAPTPIDRSQACRMLFLPIVGFAVAAGGVRMLAPEFEGDRTVFFRALDNDRSSLGRQRTLDLGQMLDVDPRAHMHREPDPAFMAESVREHLQREYGLRVPPERIEATILRGWPAAPPPGWDNLHIEAVSDAMDRVHADLAPGIRAADRISRLIDVLAAVVASLLLLRAALAGIKRCRVWMLGLGLPAMFVIFAPTFAPESALGARVATLQAHVYAVFTGGAPLPLVLLLASTAAISLLIWRSTLRAFRRLQMTDLPPESVSRWYANRV